MREFYIFSLKYSAGKTVAIWWGHNNCGYEQDLRQAGRYSEEQVVARADYYNDGTSTRAILCDEVDTKATLMVSCDAAFRLHRALTKEQPAEHAS